MIDYTTIELGDKLRVDTGNFPELKGKVLPVVQYLGEGEWISGKGVELDYLDSSDDSSFTLVATSTKYSDIEEGVTVEVACLSDEQIKEWDCAWIINKVGKVLHKSKSVHVEILRDGIQSVWHLQSENLRVVKSPSVEKPDTLLSAQRPIGALGYHPKSTEEGEINFPSGSSISFTQSDGSVVSSFPVQDETFNPSLETRKNGKNQMELVDTGFPNALMALGEVMTWAAENKGYLANDWKDIPNPSMSLLGAASRHRNKRLKGEEFDDESGLPHLAHETFNVLAQLELLLIGKL